MIDATGKRQQKIDQPQAKYDHAHDLCDFGEWLRQRDGGDNPPDQSEDDAHNENCEQHGNHLVPPVCTGLGFTCV
jgi:hypothetical protein